MKITWQAPSVSPVVLGDDSLGRGPGCKTVLFISPAFEQQVQPASYPRATAADFFGRGNLVTTYSFAVDYGFSSITACRVWQHDLGALMKTEGTLAIDFTGGGTRILAGAWQSIQPEAIRGVSVAIHFVFVGGAMSID